MGKPVVDMVVAHQRVNLRFSRQPAKRTGKKLSGRNPPKRIAPVHQRVKPDLAAGFTVGGQQQCPLLHECAHNASSSACTACAARPQARTADAFLLQLALLVFMDVFLQTFPQTGENNRAARPGHDELAF